MNSRTPCSFRCCGNTVITRCCRLAWSLAGLTKYTERREMLLRSPAARRYRKWESVAGSEHPTMKTLVACDNDSTAAAHASLIPRVSRFFHVGGTRTGTNPALRTASYESY